MEITIAIFVPLSNIKQIISCKDDRWPDRDSWSKEKDIKWAQVNIDDTEQCAPLKPVDNPLRTFALVVHAPPLQMHNHRGPKAENGNDQ